MKNNGLKFLLVVSLALNASFLPALKAYFHLTARIGIPF